MPNSAEKNRERRALRFWVSDPDHPENGWWEAPRAFEDHGKFSTYSNWACRCPRCEIANAKHSQTHRHRLRVTLQKTLDSIIPVQRNRDN